MQVHPLHKPLSNPNSFSSMKDFNTDWQRAAASVLVAIGLHMPDLVSPFISARLVDNYNEVYASADSWYLNILQMSMFLFVDRHEQYDSVVRCSDVLWNGLLRSLFS